jgi:hypothetical protein
MIDLVYSLEAYVTTTIQIPSTIPSIRIATVLEK